MNWIATRWLALFLAICALYIASEPLRPYPLHYLVKALPILVLAVYTNAHLSGRWRAAALLALLFSAGGDILLSLTFTNHFIAGLASFLVAQLIYAAIFFALRNAQRRSSKAAISLGVLGYAVAMASIILPADPVLKIAISSYLLVITGMALAATWAWRRSPLPMLGAFTFVASDSLIAWDMFASPVPLASLLIMSTYYAAQLMLISGIVGMVGTKR